MKLIIKLIVLFVFLLVTLGMAGYFLVPPAANKAVDDASMYAFGVPSQIGSVKASPGIGTTSVGFEGYKLASPTGFSETLLSIGEFKVGVGTKSMIGSTKDVDAFVLDGVNLTLVQDGLQSNLLPVLRHLRGLAGPGDEAPKAPDGSDRDGAAGPKLRLGDVRVEGISATLKLRGIPGLETFDQTYTVPAYTANLASLSGAEGSTIAEIAAHLVDDLKERALASGEGVVPANVLSVLRKTLDGGLEGGLKGGLKSGLDAAKETLTGEAGKEIDAATEKASEAIGGALEGVTKDAGEKVDELLGGKAGDAAKKAADEAKKGLKGLLGGDGE